MPIFDKHSWKPNLLKTTSEINDYLKQNRIKNKPVKMIHTIGVADNLCNENYIYDVRNTLLKSGVPYQDMSADKYPYWDDIQIPIAVTVCEPIVLIFEDDSTLELRPDETKGLLMATNSIDVQTVDGVNHANYDSAAFFQTMNGCSIKGADIIQMNSHYQYDVGEDNYHIVIYRFRFNGDTGLYLEQSDDGWFRCGLYQQNYSGFDLTSATMSLYELKKCLLPVRQVIIVDGHDSSSYFWINPVESAERNDENIWGMDQYLRERISIEEMDIEHFLYHFLYEYFDKSFDYGDMRDAYCSDGFEWNLEPNIYTYKTVEKMLEEIETCCRLLETDFNNPSLDALKRCFYAHDFEPEVNWNKKYTREEELEIIRSNIFIATDFYRRFVKQMRAMMAHSPGYDLITFTGP